MKLNAWILVVLTGLLLVGCAPSGGGGGGSGGGSPATASKSLFSRWTDVSDPNTYIDITGGALATLSAFNWTFTSGATCSSQLYINGTESTGTATMGNSIYSMGGSGDPGCASLDGHYSYSKTDTQLTICNQSNQCVTYE